MLQKLIKKMIIFRKTIFSLCLVPFEKKKYNFFMDFCKNRKGGPLQFLKNKIQKIKKSCKGGVLHFFSKYQKGRGGGHIM